MHLTQRVRLELVGRHPCYALTLDWISHYEVSTSKNIYITADNRLRALTKRWKVFSLSNETCERVESRRLAQVAEV